MRKLIVMIALLAVTSMSANVWAADMIENGKTVKFHYTLTVQGEVVDSSDGKTPLEYTHGEKMIIPGLEKELAGLKPGDTKKVTVKADDGYGQIDPNAYVEFPKNNFLEGQEPQVGMVVQIPTKDGQRLAGVVSELKENTVLINFNHPLAGEELLFDVTIVSVE